MNEEDSLAQEKEITIIVNGREQLVTSKTLDFESVVRLAFPDAVFDENSIYTVTYRKADDKKEQGSLVAGGTVKVKEGTIFDVDRTIRS